jgi:hypothetical protein
MKKLSILLLLILFSGCSSLELRNAGKSVATTGVAYVIGGPIVGIGVLATAMAYDELVPDEPKVADIETKEQAVAYVATSWGKDIVWAFVAFLVITNLIGPWLARRSGYAKAKGKYKQEIK